MRPGPFLRSAAALAAGWAVGAALFWALLNVPESNVPALALSGTLAVLMVFACGATIAVASGLLRRLTLAAAARRALPALPGVVGGLAAWAALCGLAWWAGSWWRAHLGEIDAVSVRYLGATRTAWFHDSVSWGLWLAGWALGLSLVAGLVTALVAGRGLRIGLRASVRLVPLAAAALAVVAVGEGLWRLAFWRPAHLPATWAEPVFVTAKLSLLYLAAVAAAVAVLEAHRRAARERAATGPPSTASPTQSG
jgi:hypothetical protein